MERYRIRKGKPNTLEIYWGRADQFERTPDVVYHPGPGCDRADARLLHYHLTTERREPALEGGTHVEPSLLKELESRGYDLTTLKFSIRKKVTT